MSKEDKFSTPPKALNNTTQGTSASKEKNLSTANITATTISERQQSQEGQELRTLNVESAPPRTQNKTSEGSSNKDKMNFITVSLAPTKISEQNALKLRSPKLVEQLKKYSPEQRNDQFYNNLIQAEGRFYKSKKYYGKMIQLQRKSPFSNSVQNFSSKFQYSTPNCQTIHCYIQDGLMGMEQSQKIQFLELIQRYPQIQEHLQKIFDSCSFKIMKDVFVAFYVIFKIFNKNDHQERNRWEQSMNHEFQKIFSYPAFSLFQLYPLPNKFYSQENRDLRQLSLNLARNLFYYILTVIRFNRFKWSQHYFAPQPPRNKKIKPNELEASI